MDYEIIKKTCQEKGITLESLAQKVGMSRAGMFTTFKNGTLKVESLEKISEILGVSPSYFLGGGSMERLKSCLNAGVKINVYEYLIDLISKNADIVGAYMIEMYNKQPKKIRKEHSDDYLKKHFVVEDESALENPIIYMEGIDRLRLISDFLSHKGLLYTTEIRELWEKDYEQFFKITDKKMNDSISYLNNEAQEMFDYIFHEYINQIKNSNVITFLIKENLIKKEEFVNDASRAINWAFRNNIQELIDRLIHTFDYLSGQKPLEKIRKKQP